MTPNPWVRLCLILALALGSFAVGCKVEGWRLGEQIATLKAAQATARADNAEQDLSRYRRAAEVMTAAASSAAGQVAAVRAKIQAIQVRAYAAPLPVDCRPDPERLRARNAAIDAYNAARSGSDAGR